MTRPRLALVSVAHYARRGLQLGRAATNHCLALVRRAAAGRIRLTLVQKSQIATATLTESAVYAAAPGPHHRKDLLQIIEIRPECLTDSTVYYRGR